MKALVILLAFFSIHSYARDNCEYVSRYTGNHLIFSACRAILAANQDNTVVSFRQCREKAIHFTCTDDNSDVFKSYRVERLERKDGRSYSCTMQVIDDRNWGNIECQ